MMKSLLKDIAEIAAGQGAPQGDANYCENGTPFVKAGNLLELLEGKSIYTIQQVSEEVAKEYRLKLYKRGTVLFAKSGMSCLKGYVYVLPCDAYVVSHLACITPKQDISDYLQLYFNFHKPNKLIKDEAYPSITLSDIGNLEIDLKDQQQREKIVAILKQTKNIISDCQQELLELDELVKARFVEMFGNPESNTFSWQQKVLGDVCRVINGRAYSSPELLDSGKYRVLRVGNFFTNDSWYYSDMELEPDKYCEEGDLLFAWSASFGPKIWHGEKVIYHYHIWKLDSYAATLNKFFFMEHLNYNVDILKRTTHGSTMQHFTKAQMENQLIIVPPMEKQVEFSEYVIQAEKSKFVVQQQIEKMQQLYDSLSQEYFGC